MPEWMQEQDWQFHNGKPMCFVGQMEVKVDDSQRTELTCCIIAQMNMIQLEVL